MLPKDLSCGFGLKTPGSSWSLDSGIIWGVAWVGVLLGSFAMWIPPVLIYLLKNVSHGVRRIIQNHAAQRLNSKGLL